MLRIQFIFRGLSAVVLLLAGQFTYAGGETSKSPILDRVEVLYAAPENLTELTLVQLQAEKASRVRDLSVIKEASDEPKVAKDKLLQSIFDHDDKRLQIVAVIPQMIEDYQIEGEFRDSLLGYSNTFDVDIREARKDVHKLADYKSYDFRFSAVYMSMMFKFKENPEFHKRMIADLQDPDTAIGKYRIELDESYAKVEHDKYLVQNIYSANELEQAIATIDKEISKRQHVEL